MIEPIYCLGSSGLSAYLIRHSVWAFLLGLVVRPLVDAIRGRFGR